VVKAGVFLKSMSDFAAMNEVYGRYFTQAPPARATVEVTRLAKDVLVEIDVIALAALELSFGSVLTSCVGVGTFATRHSRRSPTRVLNLWSLPICFLFLLGDPRRVAPLSMRLPLDAFQEPSSCRIRCLLL
jgi:hypothetical protein